MKRIARACAPLLLVGTIASCLPFPLFEDVGSDPHPPQLVLLGVGFQPIVPPPPPPGEPPTPTPAPVFFPPEGFVVHPNDAREAKLIFQVQYADVGGDVVSFVLRDRDGSFSTTAAPTAPEADTGGDGVLDTLPTPAFFAGTAGIVSLEDVAYTANMQGPHRLELWAEDSHGSRSEKIAFTITVAL